MAAGTTAGDPVRRVEESVASHTHCVPDGRVGSGRDHREAVVISSHSGSTTAERGDSMEVDLTTEVVGKRDDQPRQCRVSTSTPGTELEQEVIVLDPDEIEEKMAGGVVSARVHGSCSMVDAGRVAGHNPGTGSGCGQLLASPVAVAKATGNHGTTSIAPMDLHSPLPLNNRPEASEPPLDQRRLGAGFHGGSVLEGTPTSDGVAGDATVEGVDGGRFFVQTLSRTGAGEAVGEKAGGGRSGWKDTGGREADEFDESFPEFDDIMEEFGSREDFLSQVQSNIASYPGSQEVGRRRRGGERNLGGGRGGRCGVLPTSQEPG